MAKEYFSDKPEHIPSEVIRKRFDTIDSVQKNLGCKTTDIVSSASFAKLFSQYLPKILKVNSAEEVIFLKNHETHLELEVRNPQMKFLKVDKRLYYTI